MKFTSEGLENLFNNRSRLPTKYMEGHGRVKRGFPIPFLSPSKELCVIFCSLLEGSGNLVEVKPYHITACYEQAGSVRLRLSRETLSGKRSSKLIPRSWGESPFRRKYYMTSLSNLSRFLNKVNKDVDVESLYNDFYFTQNGPRIVSLDVYRREVRRNLAPVFLPADEEENLSKGYYIPPSRLYEVYSRPFFLPSKLKLWTTPNYQEKERGIDDIVKLDLVSPCYYDASIVTSDRSVNISTSQLRGNTLLSVLEKYHSLYAGD